ncbi:Aste57867_10689 [Aphanomyces stellatus]|uniref:Aste57867_10689 protein n=1 Tax=Aphanomyces stellatus TaxID=120398 RepID=A0A485KS43_9STRA|nr:hypothetical protein As57867_010649 [Aphanomyces stellatus]VFT87559.1 Aste57867_10689 [Aphanomyces stellatus]
MVVAHSFVGLEAALSTLSTAALLTVFDQSYVILLHCNPEGNLVEMTAAAQDKHESKVATIAARIAAKRLPDPRFLGDASAFSWTPPCGTPCVTMWHYRFRGNARVDVGHVRLLPRQCLHNAIATAMTILAAHAVVPSLGVLAQLPLDKLSAPL